MAELLTLLPGCIVIGGILAVVFYFYRRGQGQRDDVYQKVVQENGLVLIKETTGLAQALEEFPFGQRGGQTKIRTAAGGDRLVLLHLLQTRAAPASDADHFGAVLTEGAPQGIQLILRVRSAVVDNPVQRAVFGLAEEISLDAWPALAADYQLIGAPGDNVSALLHTGLGEWMAAEAAAGHKRSLEIQGGRALLTQYDRGKPDEERLNDLLAAGHSLQKFF